MLIVVTIVSVRTASDGNYFDSDSVHCIDRMQSMKMIFEYEKL